MTFLYRTALAISYLVLSWFAIKDVNRYLDQRDLQIQIDYKYKQAMFGLEAAKVHCDGS